MRDTTNNTAAHSYHVLAGTHGSSEELYELPARVSKRESVAYVGLNSENDIITWVPADVHTPVIVPEEPK